MSRTKTNTPVATGLRSLRDLSARSFGTTDFGRIDVPYWTEVVPNDDFTIKLTGKLKGATMPTPTIGKMYYDVRFHFVPLRILTHRPEDGKTNFVWDYFINKLSNTAHPSCNLAQITATLNDPNYIVSSDSRTVYDCRRLLSQLRLPEAVYNSTIAVSSTSALGSTPIYPWPFMAYQRIWWDRYRDKQLIDESLLSTYLPFPLPGNNALGTGNLKAWLQPRYACWPKDYFTNALYQLGTNYNNVKFGIQQDDQTELNINTRNIPNNSNRSWLENSDLDPSITGTTETYNLTTAAIRMAKLVDDYLQRFNIAGTGLINRIFSRFGVRPKEELLNMSQYLGGFRQDFNTGDILSNVETGSFTGSAANAFNYGADGSQSGQATGTIYVDLKSNEIKFHSGAEYGILMCTTSLVPYTGYFQGLHRSWTHGVNSNINQARIDYLTPEFANAGLQPIRGQELYGNSSSTDSDWKSLFGYSERYGEYGYQPDSVDGDLVLSATKTGMSALHLFRVFSAMPSLTATFTEINPAARESLGRIFNYLSGGTGETEVPLDHFQRIMYFDVQCHRSMASSMLPDLFEDNNHGNVVNVDVNGSRF